DYCTTHYRTTHSFPTRRSSDLRYISNHNNATKDAKTGELKIKIKIADVADEFQLFEIIEFEDKSTRKINSGPYAGEDDRFVPRLETQLNDERLALLLRPKKVDG